MTHIYHQSLWGGACHVVKNTYSGSSDLGEYHEGCGSGERLYREVTLPTTEYELIMTSERGHVAGCCVTNWRRWIRDVGGERRGGGNGQVHLRCRIGTAEIVERIEGRQ